MTPNFFLEVMLNYAKKLACFKVGDGVSEISQIMKIFHLKSIKIF